MPWGRAMLFRMLDNVFALGGELDVRFFMTLRRATSRKALISKIQNVRPANAYDELFSEFWYYIGVVKSRVTNKFIRFS